MGIDLGLHLAQSKTWCGLRCSTALVFYVAGESVADLEARIQANHKEFQVFDDAPFYLRLKPVYLTSEVYAQQLSDEVAELRKSWPNIPIVVFVDTLARNFGPGKSESSDSDMGAFINNIIDLVAEPHSATVIIVHHTGHSAKDRGRGHSSLPGAVDGTLMVDRRDGHICLSSAEMRNIAGDSAALTWTIRSVELDAHDNFGNPISAPVLVPADSLPVDSGSEIGMGKHQSRGLHILREMLDSAAKKTKGQSVPRIPWQEWKLAMQDADVPRNKCYDVRDSLVQRGLVRREGDTFTVPDSEA